MLESGGRNDAAAAPASARFEIVSVLGEGSGGVVYRAIDRDSGETVAIKTLRSTTGESLALLNNEFRAVQDLHHKNLVEIRDLVRDSDVWLLSMEFVHGVDFLRYVSASTPDAVHGFDDLRLRAGLRQLASALSALHSAGQIHRDVKPSNVLVTAEGRVVVLDFGLAVDARALVKRGDEGIMGTVLFMAPEQILGDEVLPSADWYAVGVILYRALTGRFPFDGLPTDVMAAKVSGASPEPPDRRRLPRPGRDGAPDRRHANHRRALRYPRDHRDDTASRGMEALHDRRVDAGQGAARSRRADLPRRVPRGDLHAEQRALAALPDPGVSG